MSSTIVHEPDTPVSSGSPSSLGVETTSASENSKSDNPNKATALPSDFSSSPVNEDSNSNSSSPSPTLNLSFIPPTNGILTPPNDVDSVNEDETGKPEKPSGRLKFYKDGILCLELSHHDEGAKTKWVQIRAKTFKPPIIRTTKEAIIPRHVSPTSFASPPSISALQHPRIESSASHSTSDDGSSMLSSPRIRESSWKKPVPQKGISACLEFYFRPASCVHNIRRNSKLWKLKFRKPYNCQISSILEQPTFSCYCSSGSVCKENVSDLNEVEKNENDVSGNCGSGKISDKSRLSNGLKLSLKTQSSNRTQRLSIAVLTDRLKNDKERLFKIAESKLSPLTHDVLHRRDQTSLPKKRAFKDTESKDLSPVRPKKSSPNRSKNTKTILNIPGLNNDFYKRFPDDMNGGLGEGPGPNYLHPKLKDNDSKSGVFSSRKSSNRPFKNNEVHEHSKLNVNANVLSSPLRSSKKSSSPKHSQDTKVVNNRNFPVNSAMCISSLPPKQQQLFQQQTMSKAISYTINSLLNNPGNQETSNKSSLLKPKIKTEVLSKHGSSSRSHSQSTNEYKQEELPSIQLFGVRGDHDQNSFLRHLLDTSDPIPNATCKQEKVEKVTHKPTPRNHTDSRGSSKGSNSSSDHSSRKSNSTPQKSPHNAHKVSSSSPMQNPQLGFLPPSPFMHPSLIGGGFSPMALSAYESLLTGRDTPLGALAAAAVTDFQFQPLIPANILSSLNSSMAAAMAASYLGVSSASSHSGSTAGSNSSSTRSPTVHHVNSGNYSSNSNPLNLSQRGWLGGSNGLIPGPSSIPVPFHAPIGDSLHSLSGSRHCSRGSRDKGNDIVDNDLPLNLSKKSKPS